MATVTGVNDRNGGLACGNHGSTFFGVAHRTDVCKAGDYPDGVGYAFSFRSGRGTCIGESDNTAAQVQHS